MRRATTIAGSILFFVTVALVREAFGADGLLWSWGRNHRGQLGDGGVASRSLPGNVLGPGGAGIISSVSAAAAGAEGHALALRSNGTVWAWGSNDFGKLGDGTTTDRSGPVQVVGPAGLGYLLGIVGVAAGAHHSVALRNDGTVLAWGANSLGQLGDGTNTDRGTPASVRGSGGT
jgi:alpha-tubulin suppressor-like RCC1 family protein